MEKIFLTTKDGIKIASDFYNVENPVGWCVLIHMMPATKESWRGFAGDLQNMRYESLAIDLRGHGESRTYADLTRTNTEVELDYRNFTDEEHQKSILDLEAAVDYLVKEKSAKPENIIIMGASIGANLALQYIVNPPVGGKVAVLFSPGLNYRGIETEPLVKNLKAGQKVFFISAKDDKRSGGNNAEMNQKLYDLTPAGVEKQIKIYEAGGHGTDILKSQSELAKFIIDFIK